MKRALTVTGCTAAVMMLSAGPVVAGEITGNGKATAAPDHGNSICLYSGLDDDDDDPFDRTQSYGQIVRMLGPGTTQAMFGTPADSCNPNAGGGEH